jgi:hypothetical protein
MSSVSRVCRELELGVMDRNRLKPAEILYIGLYVCRGVIGMERLRKEPKSLI